MDVDDDRGTVVQRSGPHSSLHARVGWLKAEALSVEGKEAKLAQDLTRQNQRKTQL